MASFNININEKPNINFSTASSLIERQDCLPVTEEFDINVINSSSDNISILNTFSSDNPYRYIYITAKNFNQSFFLEYNGQIINTSNSPIAVFVEGLNVDEVITNLILKIDGLQLETNYILNFDIQIEDTLGFFSEIKEWSINLNRIPCPYEPPVAVNDSAQVDSGQSVNINILSNDTYDTASPTIVITQQPQYGDVIISDNQLQYTHDGGSITPGVNDTDRIRYKLQEHGLESNIAEVVITIREDFNVVSDTYIVEQGESRLLDVLSNDTVPSQPFTLSIAAGPYQGTATINNVPGQNPRILYNHGGGTAGTDTFTYRLSKYGINKTTYVNIIVSRWIRRNTTNVNKDGYWVGVTYAPTLNRFVAVGLNNQGVSGMYSNNGINWNAMRIGENTINWEAVTCGTDEIGDLFIAVRNGDNVQAATSRDGITWVRREIGGGSTNWQGVAYNGDVAVAVAEEYSNNLAFSLNAGVSWTLVNLGSFIDRLRCVKWLNGRFIAMGGSGNPILNDGRTRIFTSINGTSWTAIPNSNITLLSGYDRAPDFHDVAYGNGYYVAVCDARSGGTPEILRSSDAVNWTQVNIPVIGGSKGKRYHFQGISYHNNRFYVVIGEGGGSETVLYSSNGSNWTKQTAYPSEGWGGITYGGGKFVAVSSDRNSPSGTPFWKVMTKEW